jgi:hypothetical protein
MDELILSSRAPLQLTQINPMRASASVRQSTAVPPAADIADPRTFPQGGAERFAPQIERAAASLGATSVAVAAEHDRVLSAELARALSTSEGEWLAELIAAAPSAAIARHLWRRLLIAWGEASAGASEGVGLTLFALPVVTIVGKSSGESGRTIDGLLRDSGRLASILREHGALAGNESFGLASALADADAIEVARLSALLAWTTLKDAGFAEALRAVRPATIAVGAGEQTAHLRFLLGAALAAPGAHLLAEQRVGAWGLPFAQELSRQLVVTGATVLALPRPPQAPPLALQDGRTAQREAGVQLFASNALRRLRASVGEPAAVISAHCCPAAPGGGELRLSLSSAFDSRQAEGFRCPLFAWERVGDVAAMLLALLQDCRVSDVHVLPAVYPDRDRSTGLTLLFKAESLPASPEALQ